MKKNNFKHFLIVSAVSCLLTMGACSDNFLNEEVYSAYTPETLTNKLGFEAAMVGLYQMASVDYTREDRQGWLSVWQVGTDIAWATQPEGTEIPYYTYGILTANDRAALIMWSFQYNIIENANHVIQKVQSSAVTDMTDAQKLIINAEARFFRARAYNTLATLYGGVPLVKEPITTPKNDFVRASLEEINNLIEEDLIFAVTNLPTAVQRGTTSQQRVSKYAAAHIAAEFYLRSGQPAKAEQQCNLIINSGEFSLITKRYGIKTTLAGDAYSDMFFKGNQRRSEGNTEAIWVLQNDNPTDLRGGSSGSPQQRRVWGASYHSVNGMLPADSLGGRGIARMRLNNWVLYKLYPTGDIRNSKYSIHRRFKYNNPASALYGKNVPYTGADTIFKIQPYTLKWGQFDSRDTFGYGMWKDFIVMRLAETYLFKAEAQFKQGNLTGAATTVNILRTRAQAPLVSASDISLDFILDERVRELIAEENRRMTLMRTGTLIQRATGAKYIQGTPASMATTGISQTHLLLPIPLTEIQLNSGAVLEQNPGY